MDSHSEIPVLRPDLGKVLPTAGLDNAAREVYEHNLQSVVKVSITARDGSTFGGSGVLVHDGDGVSIVTNAHVGANARKIEFSNAAGETFAASLKKFDDIDDLAVLKPDGVKIDPSRAVEMGDSKKLLVGDQLYGMGHPRGYDQPVLSTGTYINAQTWGEADPAYGGLVRDAVARLYSGNRAYIKDGEDYLNAPKINSTVPIDHGTSGGALLDKKGKLVGIAESIINNGQTMAVPVEKVQALLDDPLYKFQFQYHRVSLADQAPLATTLKGIGLVGVAASRGSQKIAAPLAGLYYGTQALEDIKLLGQDNLYQSRSHYWQKLAADGGAFAAGMVSLVPRFRMVGACLVAARLAVDTLTDFTQTTPVLDGVERTRDGKGDPLFWTSSHH